MKVLNLQSIVAQNKEILSTSLDEETILLSIVTNKYYGMDTTAHRIWDLLAEPRTVGEIVNLLIDEFEVDFTTCEKDVLSFLNDLKNEKILVIVNS